jgi:hypothetical protein
MGLRADLIFKKSCSWRMVCKIHDRGHLFRADEIVSRFRLCVAVKYP